MENLEYYEQLPELQDLDDSSNITPYVFASILSYLTLGWMNPIIKKGYNSTINLEDVPLLAPIHRAERTHFLFQSHWSLGLVRSNNPVGKTIFRCFWPHLLLNAVLAFARLLLIFVGPLVIKKFVDYTSNPDVKDPSEGLLLVTILFLAKSFEVLLLHQYNFHSQKLGMLIRSSLITTLYHKGLKLSCTSRQLHSVGEIINYMDVDAQQMSDMMQQIHNLWLVPLQVTVTFALLYTYIGSPVISVVVGVFGLMVFIIYVTRRNNRFQESLMTMRDKRMKSMNEMLNNMRVIKLQAWELHFDHLINRFREEEFSWLWKFMFSSSCNITVFMVAPPVLCILLFSTCGLFGAHLGSNLVFTVLSLFKTLQEYLGKFPQALIQVSQATISLQRLDKYLTSEELEDTAVERENICDERGVAVEVNDGNFTWDTNSDSSAAVLKRTNIEIKCGSLTAVVGMVGSGKSSFLCCLLGEMHKITGKVKVCGRMAYVPQTAWIQSGTIEDNILFGSPMNRERYVEAIRVCSLEKDLEMMEFGDKTEIGERGINLSGGQKQRIQLARAVYQDCDLYLLDDIFSAIDAHTCSHIYKQCIRGALKSKTVVLVTHQVDFLHNADAIFVMREGEIVQSGNYNEVLQPGTDFAALVAAHYLMELTEKTSHMLPLNTPTLSSAENIPTTSESTESHNEIASSRLIEEEERETGHVSLSTYWMYIAEPWGWWGPVVMLGVCVLLQCSLTANDYWIAHGISNENTGSAESTYFIVVYALIIVFIIVFAALRTFLAVFFGLTAAQAFFKNFFSSILHASMGFFDTTPSGRILSRASFDQTSMDISLPFNIWISFYICICLCGTIIVICQVAWMSAIAVIPLVLLNIWYRGYYLPTSQELTRLESITKAPIVHHFSETILGALTIRCFRKEESFIKHNFNQVNSSLTLDFHKNGANEWLGFRLELIGSFFVCFTALLMVTLPSNLINKEWVGLSLSYGLSLNSLLFWAIWISCLVENLMVSVERIEQLSDIPPEAEWQSRNDISSPNWPSNGEIDIINLKVRYRPNTSLVLKGISASIHGGEKIGVVGRSGSGKSTFVQAFFRIVEPSGGKIVIDGVDICTVGLHDLRLRFGVIPQEAVLFEGTIRSNIDPLEQYSDCEIWEALERCQFKDIIASKPEKLDSLVVNNGDNWSMGQRQMICLCRVMLKQIKIIFMDEATASVDSRTDSMIQSIIRENFKSCTIITIAHRIPTVMDCGRVLVMDAGRAKEFDSPANLIERPTIFQALVQEYFSRSAT